MSDEKKMMKKGLLTLAIVGGVIALKLLLRRKEAARGSCEKLGERIDKMVGDLACKAGEMLHKA
jgi:hypothetical protein